MNDLISRQMLLEYIHDEPVGKLLCEKYNLDGLIEQFPSAQSSSKLLTNITVQYPEVLCANCKHCENRNNEEPYCHYHAMVVTPDYFCADGEEGEWMP